MLNTAMTDTPSIILEIEGRLRAAGVSVARICRQAELDRSAWHRWKAGDAPPSERKWNAVRAVLSPVIGEVPELPRATPAKAEAA